MDPIITINNLSIRFGGILALDNISCNLPKNTISAIIGPNGAGKTTFFNCLTGFYPPLTGNILFTPLQKKINLSLLLGTKQKIFAYPSFTNYLYYKLFGGIHKITAAGVVRTFQNIRLFPKMTVLENCLVGQHCYMNNNLWHGLINHPSFQASEKKCLEYSMELLDLFNLADKKNNLANSLSYGQQKRLEIVRALCTKPKLLCLDEPAAGLNNQESEQLCALLLKLQDSLSLSIILIEHDMNMVMNITKNIIVLQNGKLIAQGTPKEIQNNQVVINAYLG